jgi:GAF domain-containing protein
MSEQNGIERESRFLEIFESGKRFTEDLMRENERLRLLVAGLRSENSELESRIPGLEERVRLAEAEAAELRRVNQEQRSQFTSIEEENCEFAERYVAVERQYSDLIHLYVSSYRLHSTLEYGQVLQILKEIVINVAGAESFGIYVVNEAAAQLQLVAQEELENAAQLVPLGQGVMGEVARTGKAVIRDPGPDLPADQPPAVIPLRAGEQVVGVLAIHRLLRQKDSFQSLDFELFDLLGSHAATALCAATLYTLSERKRVTLENLVGMVCRA